MALECLDRVHLRPGLLSGLDAIRLAQGAEARQCQGIVRAVFDERRAGVETTVMPRIVASPDGAGAPD